MTGQAQDGLDTGEGNWLDACATNLIPSAHFFFCLFMTIKDTKLLIRSPYNAF